MAYRTFREEPTYAAPETGGLFAHTMNTVSGIMADKARQKRENLSAAQRFKIDAGKGYYATDQDVLNENAKQITARAINELKSSGQLSGETALMMQDHQSLAQKSKIDYDTAKQARTKMAELAAKDKYYTGSSVTGGKLGKDEELLQDAEYNGPIAERNERIQKVLGQLGGIDTFNKGRFVSDHIQQQKLNKMQQVADQSGKKTTSMTSAIFMKPDGTPGVTDSHVVELFNKDPRVEEWYSKTVDTQLGNEVKRLKALGNDPRTAWMKGMSDEDIKMAMIENPALNIINSTPFGQRKKELAREDLSVGQDINKSTSVDYSDSYGVNGGKFQNNKIGYNPTVIEQSVNSRELGGSKNTGTVGADLTYIDKGGPIKFVTNTPYRTNTGTGEITNNASDNMEFNLRNYGLYIYDDKGQLYPTSGKTLDEMKASIDGIIAKHGSKAKFNPQMSIGLNGFAINKSKLINQSLEKISALSTEYDKAKEAGDDIKAEQIKARIDQVNQLKTMASNADVDDLDLLMSGKQLGISGIQNDMIVKATDQDFAKLKTITNGLDLRDQNKWTDDMRELNDYFKQKVNEKPVAAPPAIKKKTTTKSTAPKVGDKKDGYEFLGGDPSKPESWKKV